MPRQFKITTPVLLGAMLLRSVCAITQPAQKPPVTTADTSKVKPVLIPSFGAYTNGSKAFAADLKRLLTVNPLLKLKDEKGNVYNVVSFEILWKKKETSDDIRTGKQKTIFTYVGGDIKGSKLTESWRQEINTTLKKGEEITFGTILYFDPKRKANVRAPSLVITIL